jgi:hypothetical protein
LCLSFYVQAAAVAAHALAEEEAERAEGAAAALSVSADAFKTELAVRAPLHTHTLRTPFECMHSRMH